MTVRSHLPPPPHHIHTYCITATFIILLKYCILEYRKDLFYFRNKTKESRPFMKALKGQSNEIFDLQCFSSFEPAWVTDQWVKIFSIYVKISLSYTIFSIEKIDSHSIKLRGVKIFVILELFCKNAKVVLFR